MTGTLVLMPNALDLGAAEVPVGDVLPAGVLRRAAALAHWVAEDARSARAFLKRVAQHFPLVILSNASDDQILKNAALLKAPFHKVYTAQQAQAYKPRMQAFEYMFDMLGCGPGDVLHVSASYRYDLVPAYGLGVKHMLYVNRGYEPEIPYYGAHQTTTIDGLAALLGV